MSVFAVSFMCALSTRKQVTGKVGDEYAYTNGGFGGFTAETSLRTVNQIDVSQILEESDWLLCWCTVAALSSESTSHSSRFERERGVRIVECRKSTIRSPGWICKFVYRSCVAPYGYGPLIDILRRNIHKYLPWGGKLKKYENLHSFKRDENAYNLDVCYQYIHPQQQRLEDKKKRRLTDNAIKLSRH